MQTGRYVKWGGYDKMLESSRRVYSTEGAAPTVTTCGGGNLEPKILESRTCAMRGRNPENPSDRTAGAPTEQRLEIGGEMANTITTVQKDSLVVEPIVIDGYNRSIRAEKDTMGTRTRNCGGDVSTGNGYGIMEVQSYLYAVDEQNHCVRKDGTVGTLTTDGSSPKHNNRVMESSIEQMPQGQIEVGKQIRVRKLTEREAGRLMGVKDEDIDKLTKNLSKSAQYHCFGDSINTTCLMALFGQVLEVDWKSKIAEVTKSLCNHTNN